MVVLSLSVPVVICAEVIIPSAVGQERLLSACSAWQNYSICTFIRQAGGLAYHFYFTHCHLNGTCTVGGKLVGMRDHDDGDAIFAVNLGK